MSFADTMPDDALRKCVTDKLSIDADTEPTAEQLESVTALSCNDKGIVSLRGVEKLPNLGKLFVNRNQISDVAPLAGAPKLFSLGLEGNQISDITPLGALKELSSISLAKNRLSDISVLGTLPKWNHIGSNGHSQEAVGTPAQAGVATPVPVAVDGRGTQLPVEAQGNVTVRNGLATYPEPGSYVWDFGKGIGSYFNGTITVEVSAASAETIPDDALRACVNKSLQITDSSTHPTPEQLATVTSLNCVGKGVVSLAGVEHMTGLKTARLARNEIADVTPLGAARATLTSLDLSQNRVTSLASLGQLPELTSLNVSQTPTSEKPKLAGLDAMSQFPKMKTLTANYLGLASLAPLAGHPALENLEAMSNKFTDVAPLAGLGTLKKVNLSSNMIGDLSPLKDRKYTKLEVKKQTLAADEVTAGQPVAAPSVTKIDGTKVVATPPAGVTVEGDQVTYVADGTFVWQFDVPGGFTGVSFEGTISQRVLPAPPPVVDVNMPDPHLRACLNTKYLTQAADAPITAQQLAGLGPKVSCIGSKPKAGQPDTRITNLTGAELLTGVTELQLASNQIADLAPLTGLTQLQVLGLPGNKVSELQPLSGLTNLTKLNISFMPITSVKPLSGLTKLDDLSVTQRNTEYPGLASLEGVEGMTSLTRLVANNSQISDLTPLARLIQLKVLYVSSNQVADIAPLTDLVNLERLGLDYNKISDITALTKLTKLDTLSLANNHIADFSPLKAPRKWGHNQPNLSRQSVVAPAVPAKLAVTPPKIIDRDGSLMKLTPPSGLSVVDGKVTYPSPGDYVWTWGSAAQLSRVTQPVTEPVPAAANIPDSALRSCIATAVGLDASAVPTEPQVAALTELRCVGSVIADLTGVELLTGAKKLDLSEAGLTDVAKLAVLSGLEELKLNNNRIADLSSLAPLSATITAQGQQLSLPDVAGGVPVAVPTVKDKAGAVVSAEPPTGLSAVEGKVTFKKKGSYSWPFTAMGGAFSGAFAQVVTADAPTDPKEFAFTDDDLQRCVDAGNVFVIVDPVTVDIMGACATKFGTGAEALKSAGFTADSDSFIKVINGYRADYAADGFWWSYYHRHRDDGAWGDWEFSQLGVGSYQPKAGSIEAWVITPADPSAPLQLPRWEPKPPASPSPTPTPTVTPAPTPTVTPTVTPTPTPTVTPTVTPTPTPTVTPTPTPTVTPTPTPKPKPFTAADVTKCTAQGHVFIVVDPIDAEQLGGCASDFTSGLTALRSAGLEVTEQAGMVTAINGYRAEWAVDKKWWGYHHSEFNPETGLWSDWAFSMEGAAQYKPKPGSIEGWVVTPADGSASPRFVAKPPVPTKVTDEAAQSCAADGGMYVLVEGLGESALGACNPYEVANNVAALRAAGFEVELGGVAVRSARDAQQLDMKVVRINGRAAPAGKSWDPFARSFDKVKNEFGAWNPTKPSAKPARASVTGWSLTGAPKWQPAKPGKPDQPQPGKPDQPKPGKPDQPKPGKPTLPKPGKPSKPKLPKTGV